MSECRSCGAAIRWAVTEKGKRSPLDVVPVPDGNVVLIVPPEVAGAAGGPLEVAHTLSEEEKARDAYAGLPRYVSHFVTCPERDRHRRRGGRASHRRKEER